MFLLWFDWFVNLAIVVIVLFCFCYGLLFRVCSSGLIVDGCFDCVIGC